MIRLFGNIRRPAVTIGLLTAVVLAFGTACNQSGTGTGTGGGSGGSGGSGGGNTLLNDASGYDGTLNGKVSDQQTTRASTEDGSSAQEAPPDIDTENTMVEFVDVAGEPLLDENGNPIPAVPLNPDGSFTAEGLPVGVDFTVCVDIESNGSCDIQSCVNIPNDDPNAPGTGHVDNAQVDPLTTLVLAKLHALVEEKGIKPEDLPISPVALVTRIVDAYIHLFEESGVDAEVTLEDIQALSAEQLAALFDEVIPSLAQSGMLAARGNLGLVRAGDVNAAALAAAEIFLQAGFPIADGPDPLDLSSLGDLPGIEVKRLSELRAHGDPLTQDFVDAGEDLPTAPAQFAGGTEPLVYFSTIAEPDRNFSDDESDAEGDTGPKLPVINDYLFVQMAQLQLEGRQITLADIYDLLTSLDDGMGARLTYFVFDPTVFGPPATIFETRDGTGKAVHLDDLYGRIAAGGFQELSPEDLQRRDAEFRALLRELLADTVAPSMDTLAGAFMTDRVASVGELAARIRDARVHLPFSRTGSSTFFVVADGDPFRSEGTVSPVTVDAVVSANGTVSSVTYNASGDGKFYLLSTEGTEGEGIVGLMNREAGRPLHGPRGPLRLNMHDEDIFALVNGALFIDFVSDTGSFYPGVNVSVVSSSFVPAPSDPSTVQPAEDGSAGPNQQIFVLATAPGPGAEPVHVEYDTATGVATYNPAGRFLLQFTPDTQDTGLFMLFNESTGRPAGQEDPADFFTAPPPAPDEPQLVGDPNQLPPDGTIPPPDGTTDGTAPPPDGGTTSPDGTVPPAQTVDVVTDPSIGADGGTGTVTEGEPTDTTPVGSPTLPPDAVLVSLDAVVGLPVTREIFTHVFGTEVPNPRYNPDGDPYYDDINENGVQDADEPTSPFRPTLFKIDDWRSTDIRMYYRRADNNASVTFEDVAFDSETPKTQDGVDLVARNYLPRLNAFRFGRPNSALNLLTAFLPPEFFDGTHAFNASTAFDVFGAVAVINLMMDQSQNVEAIVDVDGPGPRPSRNVLIDAHMFVPPVGDPFVLLLKGFSSRSQVVNPTPDGTPDSSATQ